MSLVALFTSACAAAPAPNASDPPVDIEGTHWVLESGTLHGQPIPLVAGHRITLAFEGSRASGTSACNNYGAQLSVAGSSIAVGMTEMSAMGCEAAVMASETAYLAALGRVSDIAVADGRLILHRGGEVQLQFAPLSDVNLEGIADRVWALELLVDESGRRLPRGDLATLELRSDGTLHGSTGSRTLTGTYIVRGDEILATTLRADGPDLVPAMAEQDGHVVGVIGDGFVARLEDGKLILTSAGEQQLVYGLAGTD